MKRSIKAAALAAAFGVALASPSFAQRTTDPGTGLRMPYQSGFWGHTGFSFGQSNLDASCPAGFACDDTDQTWRLFAGGKFNNAFGLEVGAMNFGKFQRGGGNTDGWGLDFALVAGFPIGTNSSIFGKLGAIYGRTEVEGTAPGLATGKERGWGPRFGVGGQIGLTPNWALRADLDRYRLDMPGGKEDLDTFTLGVQYTFRP